MTHISIDIETLGTDDRAPILSIGGCWFGLDSDREPCRVFHGRVSARANASAGRELDPTTVDWWLSRSPEAIAGLQTGTKFESLGELLDAFLGWLPRRIEGVWAKSPSFDCRILRNAFGHVMQSEFPWGYWVERDVRVIEHLGRAFAIAGVPAEPTVPHRADHDATAQARSVRAVHTFCRAAKSIEPQSIANDDQEGTDV